jgi:hypothetical protein
MVSDSYSTDFYKKIPNLATHVAFDPAFNALSPGVIDKVLVVDQATHNALLMHYKAQSKQTNPLRHAIKECQRDYQRRYDSQRRGVNYFTRQHFNSSADYATYIQPFLVAQRKTDDLKGQSLIPWQIGRCLKALLQF